MKYFNYLTIYWVHLCNLMQSNPIALQEALSEAYNGQFLLTLCQAFIDLSLRSY